jgi:hypothetical protein
MKTKTKRFHLTEKENGWVLTQEGRSKPLAICKSRDTALENALNAVPAHAGLLMVHRKDGTVAEGRTNIVGGSGIRCRPVSEPAARARSTPVPSRLVTQPA